jgi:hypothetical protein
MDRRMKGAFPLRVARFIRDRLRGLTDSVSRFPLTVAFLAATAVCIAIQISSRHELTVWILSCAVGAAACAAGQAAGERFDFRGARLLLPLAGLLLAGVHYALIRQLDPDGIETAVRTVVLIFALFIALVRIAVTKSGYAFHEGFMAAFKALFQSLFFSAVIMGGCSAIIAAVDLLITPVDSDAYTHVANVVFVLFAPIFFLSMLPRFPVQGGGDGTAEDVLKKRIACPKFFEILLSDIVIPLASVYTVILLLYIVLNIGGEFWSDNRLEPMLVSYTIVVIVVTILVSGLDNKLARLFRTIFPKVLIPIAAFQTAASLLILADSGVTFSRYYVILYGVFAVCSGIVLSIFPVRKTGSSPAVIVFSELSLTPPVDAFTVSRWGQIRTLERVLTENNMLTDGSVVPNDAISDADKETVASAVEYLGRRTIWTKSHGCRTILIRITTVNFSTFSVLTCMTFRPTVTGPSMWNWTRPPPCLWTDTTISHSSPSHRTAGRKRPILRSEAAVRTTACRWSGAATGKCLF